jgi:predicted PurR-regulated permease PerM
LPFILGIIIAYIFAPPVNYLARKGLPRIFAILLLYVFLFGGIYTFLHYLVPTLETESRRFAKRFQNAPEVFSEWVHTGGAWLESIFASESGPMSPERSASLKTLSRHGLGPDSYRVGTGSDTGIAGLNETGPQQILGPGSDIIRRLGMSKRTSTRDELALRGSHVLATRKGDTTGYRLNDTMVEIRSVGDDVYRIRPRRRTYDEGGLTPEAIRAAIRDTVNNAVNEMSGSLVLGVVSMVKGLFGILTQGLIGLIVTMMVAAFILLDLAVISLFFRSKIPKRFFAQYDDFLNRLDQGLSGAIRGQLIICGVNGVLSFIGFLIFVPEYSVVLAILATVMSLIPIFGTIISTVPACLLAFSTGGVGVALAVLGWILGIHFIEANILNPKIIGHSARINPVVVVFVLIAGEHSFGLKGALLSVPVTAVVIATCSFIYALIRPMVMKDR